MFTSYWTSYGLGRFLTIAVMVRNLTNFHVSNRRLLPLAPLPASEMLAHCSMSINGRGLLVVLSRRVDFTPWRCPHGK